MNTLNNFYALYFIKLLSTDWQNTDAFKHGIIDVHGTLLRHPTPEEQKYYDPFIRVVFNIKRLLQKIPLQGTMVGKLTTALLLLKENDEMWYNRISEHLNEEGEPPVAEVPLNNTENIALTDLPLTKKPLKRFKEFVEKLNEEKYIEGIMGYGDDPHFHKIHSSLLKDKDTKNIVNDYTHSTKHKTINNILRNDALEDSGHKENVEQFDKVFSKFQNNEQRKLYRGFEDTEELNNKFSKLSVGDVYHEKGYSSTSTSPMIAHDFSKTFTTGKHGYQLHIELPKDHDFFPNYSSKYYEKEVILPRDSKFRVDKVDHENRVIHTTVIKDTP